MLIVEHSESLAMMFSSDLSEGHYPMGQASCQCAQKAKQKDSVCHVAPVMRVWPLGVVDQTMIPNHPKLHLLRAFVVSVRENAGENPVRYEQLRRMKMNHRRSVDNCKRCQNRGIDNDQGQIRRLAEFWPDGIRHRGGVTIVQAQV